MSGDASVDALAPRRYPARGFASTPELAVGVLGCGSAFGADLPPLPPRVGAGLEVLRAPGQQNGRSPGF
jgi:hypothetical protein